MTLLTPLYIFGALAISVPIVLHMIRRMPRGTMQFSSLMFLSPSPPRMTRRSRIEHWLLLLLRALALILLALAFARPFVRSWQLDALGGDGSERVVAILIDTSASMRRGNLFAQSIELAEEQLGELKPNDRVGLFTFDDRLNTVVGIPDSQDSDAAASHQAMVKRELGSLKPGWRGSALGQPLTALVDLIEDRAEGSTEQIIYLATDRQAGMDLNGLSGFSWPETLQVTLLDIKDVSPNNAGIQLVVDRDNDAGNEETYVRLTNQPGATKEQFKLAWIANNQRVRGAELPVQVAAGTSRIVRVPRTSDARDATKIELTGDDFDYDNLCYVAPVPNQYLDVLYVGEDPDSDTQGTHLYLRRGLRKVSGHRIRMTAVAPSKLPDAIQEHEPRVIIVVQSASGAPVRALREYLDDGHTVWTVLTDSKMAGMVGELLEQTDFQAKEGTVADYRMFGEIDFQLPPFVAFADPQFSDFTKIRFWRYRELTWPSAIDATMIARFDNGAPAVVDFNRGDGHLVVWTSSWRPRDSQLARSSKFLPLALELIGHYGRASSSIQQYTIGEKVPRGEPGESLMVTRPDGAQASVGKDERDFLQTDLPGIYDWDSGSDHPSFAVNLNGPESRTETIDLSDWEAYGLPVGTAKRENVRLKREKDLRDIEIERSQNLWQWALIAVIILLMLETWLAGRYARAAQIETE